MNERRLPISQSRRRKIVYCDVFEVKWFHYTLFAGILPITEGRDEQQT
jgi:hypothetical protein